MFSQNSWCSFIKSWSAQSCAGSCAPEMGNVVHNCYSNACPRQGHGNLGSYHVLRLCSMMLRESTFGPFRVFFCGLLFYLLALVAALPYHTKEKVYVLHPRLPVFITFVMTILATKLRTCAMNTIIQTSVEWVFK